MNRHWADVDTTHAVIDVIMGVVWVAATVVVCVVLLAA
jgi:hypothetical protein